MHKVCALNPFYNPTIIPCLISPCSGPPPSLSFASLLSSHSLSSHSLPSVSPALPPNSPPSPTHSPCPTRTCFHNSQVSMSSTITNCMRSASPPFSLQGMNTRRWVGAKPGRQAAAGRRVWQGRARQLHSCCYLPAPSRGRQAGRLARRQQNDSRAGGRRRAR